MSDQIVPQVDGEAAAKAQLVDALYNDPKYRTRLLQLVKEHSPHVRIPEIEAPQQVLEALKPHVEKIEAARQAVEKQAAEIAAERARDAAAKKHGLSLEEVEDVRKVMSEKKILDFDTAVEHHKMSRQVAAPRSGPQTPIQLPNVKELFSNPTQWARGEAMKVLHEMGR